MSKITDSREYPETDNINMETTRLILHPFIRSLRKLIADALKIVNAANKRHPQAEAFASVSIPV